MTLIFKEQILKTVRLGTISWGGCFLLDGRACLLLRGTDAVKTSRRSEDHLACVDLANQSFCWIDTNTLVTPITCELEVLQ